MPPPRVSPPMPVVEMIPPGAASPKAWVAASKSPQVAPPSARAVADRGSTRTPCMPDRSSTTPSSQVPYPGTLCPPPRTARSRSPSLAKSTAARTSPAFVACTTTRGLRSIIAL